MMFLGRAPSRRVFACGFYLSASLQEGIAIAKPGGLPGAVAEQEGSLLVSVAAQWIVNPKVPDISAIPRARP